MHVKSQVDPFPDVGVVDLALLLSFSPTAFSWMNSEEMTVKTAIAEAVYQTTESECA